MTRERFSPDQCGGVSLLDYKSFFPIGWVNQVSLYYIRYNDIISGQPGQPVRAQETEVRVDGVVQTQLRRPLLPLLLPELRAPPSDQER